MKDAVDALPTTGSVAGRFLARHAAAVLTMAAAWAVLNWGDLESWLVGVPTILLALGLSSLLPAARPMRLTFSGSLSFAWYFVVQSVRGGWDVARRVIDPRLPLEPGFHRHRVALPEGPARVFFENAVTLLPGTLSAELEGDAVIIHCLDLTQPVAKDLLDLEERIARLFGVRRSTEEFA